MLGASNAIVYRGTATIDGTPDVPVAVKVFPHNVQAENRALPRRLEMYQCLDNIAAVEQLSQTGANYNGMRATGMDHEE